MANKSVSSENNNMQEKAPGNLIEDQFLDIQRTMHMIAVVRDGSREASDYYELLSWQYIIDMVLEHEAYQLENVLEVFCDNFEGLKLEPLEMSPYSLLRDSMDMPPIAKNTEKGAS